MGKNKLARFEENKSFCNLFQQNDYDVRHSSFPLQGKWRKEFFKNDYPLILELGCGKGEYTVGLARRNSMANYIGIDRKGARLWRGCKDSVEENMTNVAFLRIKIDDIIHYFGSGEVNEIWITFPDPQPKKERRRLVSPNFISKYRQVMASGGLIHLKTDSREFYQYFLEVINLEKLQIEENIEDIYSEVEEGILTEIQTFYEKTWIKEGKTISYLKVRL